MKHTKKRNRLAGKSRRKLVVLIVTFSVLLLATVGGVLAYLAVSTEPIPNTFVPSNVSCEVIVTPSEKNYSYSDITVRNNSSDNGIDGFVRVRLVPTWVDENGRTQGLPAWEPNVELNKTDWFEHTDGFYYYRRALAPGDTTNNMLTAVLQTGGDYRDSNFADNDFRKKLDIYAEIIQSSPTTAVLEAWKVNPTTL